MRILTFLITLLTFFIKPGYGNISSLDIKIDTNHVIELNNQAYNTRLTDPNRTIIIAQKALKIATDLNYLKGIAESNRIMGIGYSYIFQRDSSLNNYLVALEIYKKTKFELGEAKTLNNIGNLWIETEYDKALEYYLSALKIAQKYGKEDLIAGAYLNIGNCYYRKKNYSIALKNYSTSNHLFKKIKNPIGIAQSSQNMGVIYASINQLDKAEELLIEANNYAKENEFNTTVAGINITLAEIFIAKKKFSLAEKYINEGIAYAKLINDTKKLYDYSYTSYELELKRGNYKKALYHLKDVHDQDSVFFKQNISSNINLIQQTLKQQQTQKENELTIQAQKNAKKLSVAIGCVAILSFFVIFLLYKTNNRSKKSNAELTALNNEVIKQKNKVDRINHQLEELIAERTKDLIIKNQKLSEYSSHLSHQIRGPVATLKGLMMLVEDHLVDSNEISPQIKKCVDDIDNKIMNINEALHDPTRSGLD